MAKVEQQDSPKSSSGRGFVTYAKRHWPLWVMAMPAVLFVAVFNYGPMYGVQLAFRKYQFGKGITGGDWVGFKYFQQFFESPMFVKIMTNTIRISLWTLVMGFVFPIILALLINQLDSKRVKGFVQTITYMPHFISTVVIVSMINLFLTPNSGMLTKFLGLLGITNANWMGDPNAFTVIYWVSEVWQHVGWNSIIYLAALSSIDLSLYEAAKVDGAGRMQLIRHIDFPAILPTAGVLLILNMGNVLNVGFEKTFLMQNTLNLPASEVISTYTYKIGILQNQFSYSTAIGLFNMIVNFVFLVIANQISRKISDSGIF